MSGESNCSEEESIKEQITDLSEDRGLAAIMKLRPVTFRWKDPKADAPSGAQIGLVAQEVENIFPEAVRTDTGDGTKAVSYAELVVALIKTVQQQQEAIATLTALNRQNEDLIGRLYDRLNDPGPR